MSVIIASLPGTVPDNVRAAEIYLNLGFLPIPIPRTGHGKTPTLPGWQHLRPQPADLDHLFPPGPPLNLGLLLGEPSGGLLDIDLDVPEAARAASLLLSATGWISGRAGKPRSHYWYLVPNPPDRAADEYHDLDGSMLLELRSTGWLGLVGRICNPSAGMGRIANPSYSSGGSPPLPAN